jgi:hypothetical protein
MQLTRRKELKLRREKWHEKRALLTDAGMARICLRRVCRRSQLCMADDVACASHFAGLLAVRLGRDRQRRRRAMQLAKWSRANPLE